MGKVSFAVDVDRYNHDAHPALARSKGKNLTLYPMIHESIYIYSTHTARPHIVEEKSVTH